MTAKETIKQILVNRSGMSEETISKRLERERKKTNGLISDEVLLRMIAEELGLRVPGNEIPLPTLSLGNLIAGLSQVTAVGRVVAVFPAKAFSGKRRGKVASLLIADKSGILRAVLWNTKADIIESGKIKVGQIVRFSHGYTRKDRAGKVELHAGEKCKIQIDPENTRATDFPTISRFITEIGKMAHVKTNKKVNVIGKIMSVTPAADFLRKDLSSGRILRLTLDDGTGQVPVVIWNENASLLESTLKKGFCLKLVNAKVKNTSIEGSEIHVGSDTYVEARVLIRDLEDGSDRVVVEGVIVAKPAIRHVKTSRGEVVKLAVFELMDETGAIWVSAWRKHADIVGSLKAGERIRLEDVYVRKGFQEQLELSTRNATTITIL